MLLIPFLGRIGERLGRDPAAGAMETFELPPEGGGPRVIIVGYGRVGKVTAADVQRVAAKYFVPTTFDLVIVGETK